MYNFIQIWRFMLKKMKYRVNFLLDEFDYTYLKLLAFDGIGMSEYIRSCIRDSIRYRKYYKMMV